MSLPYVTIWRMNEVLKDFKIKESSNLCFAWALYSVPHFLPSECMFP